MHPPPIVGVDPGGQHTGVVLRHGPHLHAATLVVRDPDQGRVEYLLEVVDVVAGMARSCRSLAGVPCALIAAEAVTAPGGFADGRREPISLDGLVDCAVVLGAVLTIPGAVEVDSGGNGSGPLALYPAALVGDRERKGTGRRRHLRSAWDVAGRGALVLRANLAAR